jgi:hypothetical protein
VERAVAEGVEDAEVERVKKAAAGEVEGACTHFFAISPTT